MNTKKVIGFALLGFAVWKYSQPPRRIVPPPRPPGSYQNNYAQWLAYAQNIIAQAKQLYGSGQPVYQALFGPGGVFYKEPLPTYDAGSQFWQDAGAEGLAGVGKIWPSAPPGKTLCVDGTYSDLAGRGVCSRHGGAFLKKGKPANAPTTSKASRLEILQNSLAKKEALFAQRLDQHFADVKQANGQPLNDKRNGRATMERWERQNDALRNLQNEIEKTKRAIDIEETKTFNVENAKGKLPAEFLEMIKLGELIQWRKHPTFFFVPGVEKARIVFVPERDGFTHRYLSEIPDDTQYKKFVSAYNKLNALRRKRLGINSVN